MNKIDESRLAEITEEIDRQRSLKCKMQGSAFWASAAQKCDRIIENLEKEVFDMFNN